MGERKLKEFREEVNFRDLGGYQTTDGRTVKKGYFYRSAGLYLFNKEEIENFLALHIQYILDLRTKEESKVKPDPIFPDISYVQHSGVVSKGGEEIDFSPKGMLKVGTEAKKQLEALTNYYCQMPFGNEAFHVLIDDVMEQKVPICFHCATGKDRTGIAAMLILLLLGIDEKTVLEDYMLSVKYRHAALEASLKGHQKEIEQSKELKELITMKDGVSIRIGKLVLEEIRTHYGSLEQYFLQEYNIDANKRVQIQAMYLE